MAFNHVTFWPEVGFGDPQIWRGIPLKLEGDFAITAGITPNVNRAIVPATEFNRLLKVTGGSAGNVVDPEKLSGRIMFWFTSPSDVQPSGGPDHQILKIRIVDIEPVEFGVLAGTTNPVVTAYRLFFTDLREAWVSPRGGIIELPDLNPDPGTPPDQVTTMSQAVLYALDKTGVNIQGITMPSRVQDAPPPRNWQWLGGHAPTELQKLLDECSCAVVIKSDGRVAIVEIGGAAEAMPAIPSGQQIPTLTIPAGNRRGKSVIMTTWPRPIVHTTEFTNEPGGAFDFVARSPLDHWEPVDLAAADYGAAPGSTALSIVQSGYQLPDEFRQRATSDFFRCLRFHGMPGKKGNVLRKLLAKGSDNKTNVSNIEVTATSAMCLTPPGGNSQSTPVWQTATRKCDVAVLHSDLNDPGAPQVLQLYDRLLGIDPAFEGKSFDEGLRHFKLLDPGAIKIKISYEAVSDKGTVAFFAVGFRQDAGSQLVEMTKDELTLALKNPSQDVAVRGMGRLAYQVDDDEHSGNLDELRAEAKTKAAQFLAGSGNEYSLMRGVGFCKGELSGKVAEISWNQAEAKTTFRVGGWFAPSFRIDVSADLLPGTGHKGTQTALGSAGFAQPVVPVNAGSGTVDPAGGTDCKVNVTYDQAGRNIDHNPLETPGFLASKLIWGPFDGTYDVRTFPLGYLGSDLPATVKLTKTSLPPNEDDDGVKEPLISLAPVLYSLNTPLLSPDKDYADLTADSARGVWKLMAYHEVPTTSNPDKDLVTLLRGELIGTDLKLYFNNLARDTCEHLRGPVDPAPDPIIVSLESLVTGGFEIKTDEVWIHKETTGTGDEGDPITVTISHITDGTYTGDIEYVTGIDVAGTSLTWTTEVETFEDGHAMGKAAGDGGSKDLSSLLTGGITFIGSAWIDVSDPEGDPPEVTISHVTDDTKTGDIEYVTALGVSGTDLTWTTEVQSFVDGHAEDTTAGSGGSLDLSVIPVLAGGGVDGNGDSFDFTVAGTVLKTYLGTDDWRGIVIWLSVNGSDATRDDHSGDDPPGPAAYDENEYDWNSGSTTVVNSFYFPPSWSTHSPPQADCLLASYSDGFGNNFQVHIESVTGRLYYGGSANPLSPVKGKIRILSLG